MFGLIISIIIAIVTVALICRTFHIPKVSFLFIIPPFLLLYCGFLFTALSIFRQLSGINFLICQIILLAISLIGATFFIGNNHLINVSDKRLSLKLSKFSLMTITFIAISLSISFFLRLNSPLIDDDDLTYRASTPLQWKHQNSIFKFNTYDHRQNAYVFSTGFVYLWPSLFTDEQKVPLIIYWLSFPCSTFYLFLLFREMKLNLESSLLGILIYVNTPIVFTYFTYTLVQESWLSLCLLSFIYFLIKKKRINIDYLLAGMTFGSLFCIKSTAIIFAIVLISLISKPKQLILRFHLNFKAPKAVLKRLSILLLGFILYVMLSGMILSMYQNFQIYNHPFGAIRYLSLNRTSSFSEALENFQKIPNSFLINTNIKFGYLGAVWISSILIFSKRTQASKVISLFLIITVLFFCLVKWLDDGANIERYLLGLSSAMTFGFVYHLEYFRKKVNLFTWKLIKVILLFLSLMQIYHSYAQIWNKGLIQKDLPTYSYPENPLTFRNHLNEILIISNDFGLPDSYFLNSTKLKKVLRVDINNSNFLSKIKDYMQNNQFTEIILVSDHNSQMILDLIKSHYRIKFIESIKEDMNNYHRWNYSIIYL